MRIAQLAPLAESVPPKLYGGTERVVAWLVDELVELGHDVTLFASGDSRTKGELHPVWPRALRLGRKGADPNAACAVLLEAIAKRAKDFDMIHAHIDWLPLPLLSRLGVPFVSTMHDRLDLPGLSEVLRQFPGAGFVSISDHQRLTAGGELDRHIPPRTAIQQLSPVFRSGILPGVPRPPHGGKGPPGRHPHRARRRNALAHRRQDSAPRDSLLQEAT
jgi:glycosyltransferase involved in cell wall biosynthesis